MGAPLGYATVLIWTAWTQGPLSDPEQRRRSDCDQVGRVCAIIIVWKGDYWPFGILSVGLEYVLVGIVLYCICAYYAVFSFCHVQLKSEVTSQQRNVRSCDSRRTSRWKCDVYNPTSDFNLFFLCVGKKIVIHAREPKILDKGVETRVITFFSSKISSFDGKFWQFRRGELKFLKVDILFVQNVFHGRKTCENFEFSAGIGWNFSPYVPKVFGRGNGGGGMVGGLPLTPLVQYICLHNCSCPYLINGVWNYLN